MNKAVFFDRDGVLNDVIMRNGKPGPPWSKDELVIRPGLKEVVDQVHQAGYLAFVVTNQPDISRGSLSEDVYSYCMNQIEQAAPFDALIACLHDNHHNCCCRKPKPGMLIYLAYNYDLDLSQSFMVGDTIRDVGAAQAAGCNLILYDAPYNRDLKIEHRVINFNKILSILRIMLEFRL